MKGDDFIGAGL